MNKTLQQLAQEALDIQGAVNLTGLIYGWAVAAARLAQLLGYPPAPTGQYRTTGLELHPINQLWASKLHSLAGMGYSNCNAYAMAHARCTELALGRKEVVPGWTSEEILAREG